MNPASVGVPGIELINRAAWDDSMLGFHMGFFIPAVLALTCGTIFLMWIGEQITEYGVGNGISLLIVTGIVDQVPIAFGRLVRQSFEERSQIVKALVLAAIYLFIVIGVVYMSKGQRRIPRM